MRTVDKLLWTKSGKGCPKNQLEWSDEGFKVFALKKVEVVRREVTYIPIGVDIKVKDPLTLFFNQFSFWNKYRFTNPYIIMAPNKPISLSLKIIGDQNFIIKRHSRVASMLILPTVYNHLFQVSNIEFNRN